MLLLVRYNVYKEEGLIIMFKKYIFVFAFILIFVSCIGGVVATEDINNTDSNVLATESDVDVVGSDFWEFNTLNDLDEDIQGADSYLHLKYNYRYTNDTDYIYNVKYWPKAIDMPDKDLDMILKTKYSGINITKDIILDCKQVNNYDGKLSIGKTSINCRNQCHVFNIYNCHVVFKDIIFSDVNYFLPEDEYTVGYDFYGYGGAIHAENSTVEIINCSFVHTTARYGGAIYGENTNISIKDSTFWECYTGSGTGGALWVYSGFTSLFNCTFNNCYVPKSGSGGAVCLYNGVVSYCNFINNSVKGDGGALEAYNVNISYCNFTGNHASSKGGAVSLSKGVITNSIFKNNNGGYCGGALYATTNNDNVKIISSLFENNTAEYYGGAYIKADNLVLVDNVFKYNNATHVPTDLYINSPNVQVKNCTVYSVGNVSDNVVGVNVSEFKVKYNDTDENNDSLDNNTYNNPIVEPKKDTPNNTKTTNNNNIIKLTPVLTAKKATFKVKKAIKKYTVTLKVKNKPLKNIKLTLKIKGKTYTSTTNKKGKAVFKIRNLKKKGTYKATVIFKGDKYYNKFTKTVKIRCK